MKNLTRATLGSLAALIVCACQGPPPDLPEGTVMTEATRQIKVITSGGFSTAFNILGPIFEEATGIEVITEYGSSLGGGPESIPVRLGRGESPDVLIFNDAAFRDLAESGHLRRSTRRDLGRSIIGMAVRSGAPKPDISSAAAFVETLLAAESIGYSASVSGTYLSTELFPRLGIWEEIEPKTQRVVTERVASVVARGEVEIGFQAVAEILSIEGADYVGPIPNELQQTSTFLAVITERATNSEDAERLIDFLSSEAVASIIESTGLRPVILE